MERQATNHDKRRLFYSTVMNDNPVDCLISKVTVLQVSPRVCWVKLILFLSLSLSLFFLVTISTELISLLQSAF